MLNHLHGANTEEKNFKPYQEFPNLLLFAIFLTLIFKSVTFFNFCPGSRPHWRQAESKQESAAADKAIIR